MLRRWLSDLAFRRQVAQLSREGSWVAAGQVFAVIGSLVGVRWLTELMTPSAYGELALAMTIWICLNQLVLGPLAAGAARFYAPAVEKRQITMYLAAVRSLMTRSSSLILLLTIVVSTILWFAGQTHSALIAIGAVCFALLNGASGMLSGIQSAARQRALVACYQAVEPWARFVLAALLILWFGQSSVWALVGYGLAALLVLIAQGAAFFRYIPRTSGHRPGDPGPWTRHIWAYSGPMSAFGIFTAVHLVSDRWALQYFGTVHEVGLYAVLFQLGYHPIAIVTSMSMQLLAPVMYERAGDASDPNRITAVARLTWRLSGVALCTTVVAAVITYALHTTIFNLLVAPEYRAVSHLLPWVVIAGGLFATGQTLSLDLLSRLRTRAMVAVKIATAVIGILSNCIGAYYFGAAGVVFANVCFALIYIVWVAVLSMQAINTQARS